MPGETLSYFFFKQRLKKKLASLYEIEDPWDTALLRDAFVPLIRKQMNSLPETLRKAPVLDAGGGEAHYLEPLRDLIAEYHLVDINPTAVERARKRAGNMPGRFLAQSLDAFRPRANFYGMIWLFNILTYLGHSRHPNIYRAILLRLWNGLKPGGKVLMIHPYYSEQERQELMQAGRSFQNAGGTLNLSEEMRLGKQQHLIQACFKPQPPGKISPVRL